MNKTFLESLLIAAGGLIFLFSLSLDLLHRGSPGIGFEQFAGMVIGIIIILISLRYLLLPDDARWDWLLFAIYLCGILFVGLRPGGEFESNQVLLFGMNTFSKTDFVVNVAGFIPLGFLAVSAIRHGKSHVGLIRLIAIVGLIGLGISLTIETLQYLWVSGRYSSVNDLLTNTIGALIGATGYIIFRSHQFKDQNI